jgi:L-fuculose-phosphate aldolase
MSTRAVRESVVELCHDLVARGYFAATGGNVALRIDADLFAVTPSATDYYSMRFTAVSVLRMADLRQIEGDRPPSVESSLHARVLRARPDCNCSIHTHQPIASACALLSRTTQVRDSLPSNTAVVGYAPSGTRWLAAKLARAVRPDINAYLMRNHGALCCGPDAATTVARVTDLEAQAAQYLKSCIRVRAAADASLRPALQRVLDRLK